MSTSSLVNETATARDVRVTSRALVVELRDGRTVSAPLQWYPRLVHGTPRERQRWALIGPGLGIHWPALDEDISVEGLLQGRPSGESQESFSRWLNSRRQPANKHHLRLAVLGAAIGVPFSLAAATVLKSMLFGVAPQDLATLVVSVSVLLLSAVLAGYLPARRAARIEPATALRAE